MDYILHSTELFSTRQATGTKCILNLVGQIWLTRWSRFTSSRRAERSVSSGSLQLLGLILAQLGITPAYSIGIELHINQHMNAYRQGWGWPQHKRTDGLTSQLRPCEYGQRAV